MNQINYEPIQLELKKWLKERHLTITSQKENLLGNIMEELTELVRANNDEEIIDALCDIMVFTTNATSHNIKTLYLDSLPSVYLSTAMTSKEEFIIDIVDNIMFDTTDNILLMCIKNILDLGYDPIACMNQTIKEVSSRKQDPIQKNRWIENPNIIEKWQKWKEQPIDTLYKANYLLCKRK